jgi:hypothetical protein
MDMADGLDDAGKHGGLGFKEAKRGAILCVAGR